MKKWKARAQGAFAAGSDDDDDEVDFPNEFITMAFLAGPLNGVQYSGGFNYFGNFKSGSFEQTQNSLQFDYHPIPAPEDSTIPQKPCHQ